MNLDYESYTRDALKNPVKQTFIDGWQFDYLAFESPTVPEKPPILVLGGAFQNFNSYKYCMESLLAIGSVILIDPPAMGANPQLTNTENNRLSLDLELEELAILLGRWTDLKGLNKVSLMGMSLGSVVAATYAHYFAEKMHRLVLMGVMQETRASWRMLLQESLHVLDENRMDDFGQGVILYLINHARLNETRMSPTAKRLFHTQMSSFNDNEKQRYHINANRLLRLQKIPTPNCETLVATGQYDSFTLPHENAHFALQCPNMQFALVNNADHVPQLQRRKETLALFCAFLNEEDLTPLEGITLLNREEMKQLERRRQPRFKLNTPHVNLKHQLNDENYAIQVVDLNYFGALFDAGSIETAERLMTSPRHLTVQLTDSVGDLLDIDCLIFERVGQSVRVLFKHTHFEKTDRLLALLASEFVTPS